MQKFGKLITKKPIYVRDKPYEVTVREVSINFQHYYRVKFYNGNPFYPKASYEIDYSWGNWENKDYKSVIQRAIRCFEKDIDKKLREQNNLDDLAKWDGKMGKK